MSNDAFVAKNPNPMLFQECYLDDLTDALALLEIASQMLRHHDDIQNNDEVFTGLIVLIEQVRNLIDIKDNLISYVGV